MRIRVPVVACDGSKINASGTARTMQPFSGYNTQRTKTNKHHISNNTFK